MPHWLAQDRDGHLGVFAAEHMIPDVAAAFLEDDLDLRVEISRRLRVEARPVRGVHAKVRGGEVQMLASASHVRPYAKRLERITEDVIVASFTPPQRGRAAAFMPGIRTFGTGQPDEPSSLERVHAGGLCGGCAIDTAGDDLDVERQRELGIYVYECDEQLEMVQRARIPEVPLMAARIGSLAKRCLRYDGQFATTEQFPMSAFELPSSP